MSHPKRFRPVFWPAMSLLLAACAAMFTLTATPASASPSRVVEVAAAPEVAAPSANADDKPVKAHKAGGEVNITLPDFTNKNHIRVLAEH